MAAIQTECKQVLDERGAKYGDFKAQWPVYSRLADAIEIVKLKKFYTPKMLKEGKPLEMVKNLLVLKAHRCLVDDNKDHTIDFVNYASFVAQFETKTIKLSDEIFSINVAKLDLQSSSLDEIASAVNGFGLFNKDAREQLLSLIEVESKETDDDEPENDSEPEKVDEPTDDEPTDDDEPENDSEPEKPEDTKKSMAEQICAKIVEITQFQKNVALKLQLEGGYEKQVLFSPYDSEADIKAKVQKSDLKKATRASLVVVK